MSDPNKPCPFCGGTELLVVQGTSFRWRRVLCTCGANGPEVRIQTMGAGLMSEWEEAAKVRAFDEWNTRP